MTNVTNASDAQAPINSNRYYAMNVTVLSHETREDKNGKPYTYARVMAPLKGKSVECAAMARGAAHERLQPVLADNAPMRILAFYEGRVLRIVGPVIEQEELAQAA